MRAILTLFIVIYCSKATALTADNTPVPMPQLQLPFHQLRTSMVPFLAYKATPQVLLTPQEQADAGEVVDDLISTDRKQDAFVVGKKVGWKDTKAVYVVEETEKRQMLPDDFKRALMAMGVTEPHAEEVRKALENKDVEKISMETVAPAKTIGLIRSAASNCVPEKHAWVFAQDVMCVDWFVAGLKDQMSADNAEEVLENLKIAGVGYVKLFENKCPRRQQKSVAAAILLAIFLTPIAERFYLGYHWTAVAVLVFVLSFCSYGVFGTQCVSYILGHINLKDKVNFSRRLVMASGSIMLLGGLIVLSFGVWVVVDLSLLAPHILKDAYGCEMGQ